MRGIRLIAIVVIIAICSSLCLVGCNGQGEEIEEISVKLDVGTGYQIESDGRALYDSSNERVVVVDDDGFIYAQDAGDAIVTELTMKGRRHFLVSADYSDDMTKSEEKPLSNFTDINKLTSYIGYGINVIDGDPNNINNVTTILDTDKLLNGKNTGNTTPPAEQTTATSDETTTADNKKIDPAKLIVETYKKVENEYFSGESIQDMLTESNRLIKANGEAKAGEYFCGKTDVTYNDIASKTTAAYSKYDRYNITVSTHKLAMKIEGVDYVKDYVNDTLIRLLNQPNMTEYEAKEIIRTYGTHVILGGTFGGKIEANYYIKSENTENARTNVEAISNDVNMMYSVFSAKGNINYDSKLNEKATQKNVQIKEKIVVDGGKGISASTKDLNAELGGWIASINESNSRLIGFDNRSLLGIWKLTNSEQNAKLLENVFNQMLEERYSEFVEKYTPHVDYTKTESVFELGAYPQSEAHQVIREELAKGSDCPSVKILPEKFEEYNVLEYTSTDHEKKNYNGKYVELKIDDNKAEDWGYHAGETRYFKVEPIKWARYYENYCMPANILDARPWKQKDNPTYNNDLYNMNIQQLLQQLSSAGNRGISMPNNYATSDVREFLNGTFYNFAFNTADKYNLKEMSLKTANNCITSLTSNKNAKLLTAKVESKPEVCRDMVTLIPYDMAYFYVMMLFSVGGNSTATDFAKARGVGYTPQVMCTTFNAIVEDDNEDPLDLAYIAWKLHHGGKKAQSTLGDKYYKGYGSDIKELGYNITAVNGKRSVFYPEMNCTTGILPIIEVAANNK